MANDAKFNFYLNRSGPRGQKGERGDQGFSPSITVNANTADEYTLLIQNEYDSFVTDNIRPTYDDRGGTYVRVDRANNVQYFGSADIATTANYGEVKLAQASDLASTVDVGDSNVITVELLKTWFDGQLADNLVTTTNNVTIQGQKVFATPTRFMDTVRVGNRLVVSQEDTGTITFDSSDTGTVIGAKLTSTGDASFSQDVKVDGIVTIKGGLTVAGNAVISSPQLGNTTINGALTTKADINIQGQDVHLQHANPTMYLKNMDGTNEIEIFRGLFTAGNPSPADNYLSLGHSQLQLNLTGKAIKANGKDVATADTVDAVQSDLNIAKQDIIEAQSDIDNLQMNKQDKLTAGTGITIDADNVISATGGVVDLPIASSTTLGGIKVGENLTISEDGTLSSTGGGGGTGDVSAAGDNTFTGENTFNGVVNLNGVSAAENLTVKRNLTSNGEINAVSIKTTGLRSDDIQTTANKKYLTEADVDNQTIQVVDGKLHANLDELGNEVNSLTGEVNTLSGEVAGLSGDITTLQNNISKKQDRLTAGEGITIVQKYANELEKVYYDSSGNVLSDVTNYELKYGQRNNLFVYDNLNLSNKFEFSVRIPTSVLKSSKSQLVVNFSSTINNDATNGAGIQILKSNSGLTYQMGLMSRNDNWRTNNTFSYESVPDYFDVTVTRADNSTKTLHLKFQCPLDSSAYEFDWDDSTNLGGIFPLNSSGLHLMIAMGWGDPFTGDFSNINFSYASLGELKTTISSTVQVPTKTSELTNDSGFITADAIPSPDLSAYPAATLPVNNCVLAMPTAPTFDGTNVKVYAGTKVAIPNGLNADGTCKSNIVTLTAGATINQSTFNGDITLMLKSDGTIDQTAYSYFEVDDISTITTLTAYCWYYDRKTNSHYLASSTGAKQGPYQRIKIGSYNQAEAATTKYFKTYKPIALEKLDITGSCIPDYTAGVAFTRNADHAAPCDGVVLIFTNLSEVASASCYMTINGVRLNTDMGGNSAGTYFLYFPVAKGDTYNWTDISAGTINNYTFYPLKGAK
jgi:cytoskeletal protein CcmA (bactofilin family)